MASASHDLNNIFSIILNYAGFIMMELPPHLAPLKGDVEEIRKAAQRGAAIARGLHTVGEREISRPDAFDLNAFIDEARPSWKQRWGNDIDFHIKKSPEVPRFEMDRRQLETILDKLFQLDFPSPSHRQITIETGMRDLVENQSNGPKMKTGRYAALQLTDSAREISPEEIDQVFHPYHRLGFSIVYSIVKHFHGYVWLYSEKGYGTAYKLYFPTLGNASALVATNDHHSSEKMAILVVENETSVRAALMRILEELGHDVLVADCMETARGVIQKYHDEIEVMLIDTILPDGNAKEFVRELEKENRKYPTVYMSGYGDAILRTHGILESGDHFLSKPFGKTELVQILQSMSIRAAG